MKFRDILMAAASAGGGAPNPEMVVNGSFQNGLTGWSQTAADWSAPAGVAVLANNAGTSGSLYQLLTNYIGVSVHISFDLVITSGILVFRPNYGDTTGQVLYTTSGTKTIDITPTGAISAFEIFGSVNTGVTVDNVSIIRVV